MIANERQYEISKRKLTELQQAYDQAEAHPRSEVPPRVRQAGLNGISVLMSDVRAELAEYEELRSGRTKRLDLPSVLDDLPAALVRARVARGWTHKDLARALNTTQQQIQKDESGGYAKASLRKLHRVAEVLDLRISGSARLRSQ